ncbi:MAG TPA: TonB-dependent receptor [Candidatus Babeliaceae bacterium]|jgi:vitamin B12 transporter|nr:TonB-dependent receptor [Candidatus Babeliaceae bacterium]
MRKIFVVAALVFGSQLKAQEDTISKNMNEVVITANKFPQKLGSTGKHLTVITREQILQSGGKDLAQVLNETAGVVLNGATSNPGKDKSIFLQGATSAYTLILLDGVPLNDPTGAGGTFDIRLLPLENVERIEILKGSQSTLYGSNAVAGVINIISRKSEAPKPQLNGLISYGSYNSFKGSANISQKIKWLEYNLNYVHDQTDGISEAKDTTGNSHFDKDGFTQNALQAIIGFNLSDHLKISPFYRFTKFKGGYDADAFIDAPDHYTGSLQNTGLTGYYNYRNGSVQFNYGYDNTKRDYVSQYGEFVTKGKFHSADVYTDPSFSKNVKLVAGINFQRYRIDASDTSNSIFSPYASIFLKNNHNWTVELGGRFNHHNKYGNNFTYSVNPSYLIHEHVKLFINLTSGFRAPSISELFGPFGSNPDLTPEKSSTQELGLQSSAFNHKLDYTLTGFNRIINDVIIYMNSSYENRDKQHDYGAEAELNYTFSDRLQLGLTYDYVNGKITQKTGSKDTSFFNLVRRPKNNLHAFLQYHFYNFTASTSLQITGKRTDTYYDPITYMPRQVNLKSYALLNFYAAYSFCKNKLKVFVDAKNITNNTSYYEVYGYSVTGLNITGGIRFQL